ncbi:bifunctional lysylphosphatidylglycerol flippase/synthetase MprF [Beijerinckia sp. L45]|uniref:bifunctional lysylphosphatidylglycerol flippase/synthetase MprF n=1 Tax=Beijerinckia sp. L45 TaxID=1641855 RepID=UPI001AEE1D5A|nr:bifunctional lysylphosphatidylglycerol flippase/synthetase MprF [Beijerinckia sp. L45]
MSDPIPARGIRRRAVDVIFFTAGVALVVAVGREVTRSLDYHALIQALRHTTGSAILLSIFATAVSFISLVGRDVGALRFAKSVAPRSAIVLAGFCGTALSNAVGLGGLTGAAVRYRIYGAVGIRPDAVARIVFFIAAGFGLGLAVSGAVAALFEAPAVAILVHWSANLIRIASLLLLVLLAALTAVCRGRSIGVRGITMDFPGLIPLAAQIALTVVDLIAAAAALWVLLPVGAVGFGTFLPIFVAAIAIGVISHVPGGLGVFEAVVLAALHRQVPSDLTAAALLAFRGVYFILPLFASTGLLAVYELRRLAGRESSESGRRLINSATRLIPTFLAVLTFAAGVMLVASGATPAFNSRLAILALHLPLWMIETSHFLGSLVGLLLLFLARGLFHRLDGAWWLAVVLTVAAFGLSLAKGLAYGEASVLAALFVFLIMTRRQFPRRASLIAQSFTAWWFIAVGAVLAASCWIMIFAFQNVRFAQELWWQVEVEAQAPRSLRAVLGVCIATVVFGLMHLLRVAKGSALPPLSLDLDRAAAIVSRQNRSDASLVLMGDKSVLFSDSGNAFLMFAKRGRSWVALLDPVGPRTEWTELIWRFVERAAEHGGRAAFYQVRPDSLPLYIDAGLRIIKIGEEAMIPLQSFTLQGSRRSNLRYTLKRSEREGLTFELLSSEDTRAEAPILQAISAEWLKVRGAREKGFSVASFEPAFVAAQSIAMVRQNGKPVAFMTVMTTDTGQEATVGLMRHIQDTSSYTMEFLFLSAILALKGSGVQVFSLGMAPLSGLSPAVAKSDWSRLGNLIWRHGNMLYNFQGVRTFKGKFDPTWEPRYLAVSGAFGPVFALADVVALTIGSTSE